MRLTRLVSVALLSLTLAGARRPHYGGTLRVETKTSFAAIDPASPRLLGPVFETLVRIGDNGEPRPWLATAWTHDAAKRKWVFTVRPGITFHNGEAWNPTGGVALVEDRKPIEEILRNLAKPEYAIVHRLPDGSVVGTGPFRVAQFEPGHSLTLDAFEECWAGRPYLDKVEIRLGRTLRDQALDFETGKADVIELSPADIRRAQQRGGKVLVSSPVDVLMLIGPESPALRQALALAIDRASIHNVLLQKQGEISGALLPQWISGYAFVFPATWDPARARQLAAGSKPLTFAYDRQTPLLRSIAERIILNAQEAGLTLRPVTSDAADVRLVLQRATSLEEQADPARQYESEKAEIESMHAIPLFHLPVSYQLAPAVQNWGSRRAIALDQWRLEDVWIEP